MNHVAKFAAITLLPLLLLGAECQPSPVNPPTPPAAGGSVSTGGSPATGGAGPIAGAAGQTGGASTGGAVATGGAPAVEFPGCLTPAEKSRQRARNKTGAPHKFGPPTAPRSRAMRAGGAPVTGADVFWKRNRKTSTNQDPYGACTGFDAYNVSSTQPFTRVGVNQDGFDCYSAATKIDNGCAWDAKTCPNAWPPNDAGSWATSSFAAATSMGWFTGTRNVVQTPQGWHDALLQGPCGFDQNWYAGGFSTDECGHVSTSGKLAGGHSTAFVGFDVANQRGYLENSWTDDFGVKGYFYYTVEQLWWLWYRGANMVCPNVPGTP